MSPSITFTGVDNAISNLNYRNKRALKYKFVNTLRSFYTSEELFDTIREIDTEKLIGLMWETDDPAEIRSKKINFTSIKAAVNSDLKKLYEKGMNSEGLTVGPDNIFEMSSEAKDQLYQSFVNSIQADGKLDFNKVSTVLNMINSFLETAQNSVKDQESDEVIRKIQAILNSLSTKVIDEDYDPELSEGEKLIIEPDDNPDDDFEYLDSEEEDDSGFDFDGDDDGSEDEADELEFLDEEEDEFDIDELEDEFDDIEDIVDEEFEYLDEEDEDYDIDEDPEEDEYEEIVIDEDEIQEGDEVVKSLEDEYEDIEFTDDDEEFEEDLVDEEFDEFDLEEEDEIDFFDEEEDEIFDDDEYDDLEYDEEDFEFADDEDVEYIDEDDEFEDEIIEDDDFEEIELDEDEEFEFIEDDEDIEFIDEDEDPVSDEDYEQIELDEDEELDFEDIDDDFDEVEEDEFSEIIDDDYDIEEIDEDEDIEEIEGDDFEFVDDEEDSEDVEFEELDDEDFEELELDDDYDYEELEEDEEDIDFIDDDEDFELQEVDEEYDDLEIDQDELEDFDILDEDSDYSDASDKNRLRSEKFDEFLGTIEKQFNLYEQIPAGRYKIGTEHPKGNELIEQRVSLPDFYIGKYPVTNSLFEIFVQRTGYVTTAEKKGFGKVYEGRNKKIKDPETGKIRTVISSSFTSSDIKGATWFQPEGPGSTLHNRRHHPVVQVSYDDCVEFAKWVGKRLPTEFEWEGAARTKKGNLYPWGNKFDPGFGNMNSSETTNVDYYSDGVNRYDIFDLLGNVHEWTRDETDPPYKRENNGKFYIVKGGSFISGKNVKLYSRSMFKNDFTANILGFRCVLK